MLEIFDFLNNVPYLDVAIQGALAAHGLALFIVNLTETPKDNEIVGKVYKYIEMVAGIVTKKAKG